MDGSNCDGDDQQQKMSVGDMLWLRKQKRMCAGTSKGMTQMAFVCPDKETSCARKHAESKELLADHMTNSRC